MRITERSIYDAANVSTGQARERLQQAAQEMSTGLRVQHPGDDPVAAASVLRTVAELGLQDSTRRALDAATTELNAADTALGGFSDALNRAYEVALQAGNDTNAANDRANAATEIRGIFAQVVGILNSKVGNRFIFGGTADDSAPFDDQGNYLGKADVRRLEVSPGVDQDISVRADVIARGVGGGVDVLDALKQLEAALSSNNGAGIRAATGQLRTGLEQVTNARTAVGTASNVISLATEVSLAAYDEAERRKATLTEVDSMEVASRLALSQRALEAALAASAQSFQLTLLNRLK